MSPETSQVPTPKAPNRLFVVTTFSKYFALALFITLPIAFLYVGYEWALSKEVAEQPAVSFSPKHIETQCASLTFKVEDYGDVITAPTGARHRQQIIFARGDVVIETYKEETPMQIATSTIEFSPSSHYVTFNVLGYEGGATRIVDLVHSRDIMPDLHSVTLGARSVSVHWQPNDDFLMSTNYQVIDGSGIPALFLVHPTASSPVAQKIASAEGNPSTSSEVENVWAQTDYIDIHVYQDIVRFTKRVGDKVTDYYYDMSTKELKEGRI